MFYTFTHTESTSGDAWAIEVNVRHFFFLELK